MNFILLTEALGKRQHFVLVFLFLYFLTLSTTENIRDSNPFLPICNKTQNSFILNSSTSFIQNFTSPNYPQNYPLYSNCIWVIAAPIGQLIKLTFSSFSIYTTSDSKVQQCPYAYVQVIEEGSSNNAETIGRFCGSRTPQTIYSRGGKLRVVFKNTLLTSAKGFVAQYSTVNKGLACSTQNTLDENSNILLQQTTTGLIKPPKIPDSYNKPIDCTWKIALPPNNGINITLLSFTAKEQATCSDSSLEVYNGRYGVGHGARIGFFCKKHEPRVLYSSGRFLSLRWKAKGKKMAVGFKMEFRAFEQSKSGSCDASNKEIFISGLAGSIFSPGYPIEYPTSLDCTWSITVPNGLNVILTFKSFQLEPGSSCSDNVEVRDDNKILAKLCGSSLPKAILSYSQNMQIQFKSNLATSGKGFLATFEATKQEPVIQTTPGIQPGVCSPLNTKDINNNLKLSGSKGSVLSPLYPSQYPNSISCKWVITVSTSKRIHLVFEDFWIDDQHGCQGDYLEIRDGSHRNSPLIGGKKCGNKKPSEIYSTGSYLWLEFVSDSRGTSHGFKAKYSAVNKPFNRFIAVGVGIGALVIVLIVILVYWKIKKKRNKNDDEQDENESDIDEQVTPDNALLGNGTNHTDPNVYEPYRVSMEATNNHTSNNLHDNGKSEEFAWFKPSEKKRNGFGEATV